MSIYYHGTSVLFSEFDISHLFEGNNKCKFGIGIYLSTKFETAALYAGKGKPSHYIYTVDVPDLTPINHIHSLEPINQTIVDKVEGQFGILPDIVKSNGKFFRKYIGNKLIGASGTLKQMTEKASIDAEIAVSKYLYSIGVLYLIWPQAQAAPNNGQLNLAVLEDSIIKIVKIESIEHDAKGKYLEGSKKEIQI